MVTGGLVTVTMQYLNFKLLAVGEKLPANFNPYAQDMGRAEEG